MNWLIPLLPLVIIAGVNDPYKITRPSKIKHVKTIVKYAEVHGHDPYELLAIAITESNLNPRAISSAGAVGLFQVMCKFWYKRQGYSSIAQCNKELLKPEKNIDAGVSILTTYRRKYKQCKGDLAYRCYFAGAGWRKYKPGGKTAKSIIRYEKKVRERRIKLPKYYSDLIKNIRANAKPRS